MDKAQRAPFLTEYEPQDLSLIPVYKFISERTFENDATAICDALKDISKYLRVFLIQFIIE